MAELVDKFINKSHKLERALLSVKDILNSILERIEKKEESSS